ncbi:hypothetical protein BDZ90DRAFT_240603, partial [Jaminaea rosea]
MAASYASALFYYLLGGVTFLPLVFLAGLLHFIFLAPRVGQSSQAELAREQGDGDTSLTLGEKAAALEVASQNAQAQAAHAEADKQGVVGVGAADVGMGQGLKGLPAGARRIPATGTGLPAKPHRSGWLVVRRQFAQLPAVPSASGSQSMGAAGEAGKGAKGAGSNAAAGKSTGYMSAMYRGILDYRGSKRGVEHEVAPTASSSSTSSPHDSRSVSPAPSSSSIPGPSQAPPTSSRNPAAPHETFYCILKEPVLFLYSSSDPNNAECLAAIDLRGKRVSIWVAGEGDVEENDSAAPRIKDGELFQKRNAVRILAPGSARTQWFVFFRSATDFEDWYHALYYASLLPTSSSASANGAEWKDPIEAVFGKEDMMALLTSLDSLPDPIPLRWLNAMVGRIFYSIYRTSWLEDYITHKLTRKISRVRTPGFLSDVRVREVSLGSTPPAFSRPMLKSLTGEGEASMEVAVHYRGALRLTISTVLTISLGSRFKPYNVPLVLAVVLTSLEGNLLLQVKPPPSNRLWFGFTHLPKMEVDIEPVVSERKVQWSMVKRIIEGRIKELMIESVVVPNMDDLPFYDTRGG